MVFLEDYDMDIAREMVQGVDIWLNTPRRPNEACGTSGMKAVANGALHLSILDGWWDEGYEREIGWAIGNGEEYDDHAFQDELESRALFDILEKRFSPFSMTKALMGSRDDG
jgi:starch phosphorylase